MGPKCVYKSESFVMFLLIRFQKYLTKPEVPHILQGVRKGADQAIILKLMLLIVLLKLLPQMIRTYMTCLSYLHSLLLIHKLIVACFS